MALSDLILQNKRQKFEAQLADKQSANRIKEIEAQKQANIELGNAERKAVEDQKLQNELSTQKAVATTVGDEEIAPGVVRPAYTNAGMFMASAKASPVTTASNTASTDLAKRPYIKPLVESASEAQISADKLSKEQSEGKRTVVPHQSAFERLKAQRDARLENRRLSTVDAQAASEGSRFMADKSLSDLQRDRSESAMASDIPGYETSARKQELIRAGTRDSRANALGVPSQAAETELKTLEAQEALANVDALRAQVAANPEALKNAQLAAEAKARFDAFTMEAKQEVINDLKVKAKAGDRTAETLLHIYTGIRPPSYNQVQGLDMLDNTTPTTVDSDPNKLWDKFRNGGVTIQY